MLTTETRYNIANPPPNIATAEERIERLVEGVQNIEAQLSNKAHGILGNEDWTDDEYNSWRMRAMRARGATIRELRFIKRWIKQERIKYNAQTLGLDINNPKSLIQAAYKLLVSLRDEVEFTAEEGQLVDMLHEYLQHR